jgi:hypothetical protein
VSLLRDSGKTSDTKRSTITGVTGPNPEHPNPNPNPNLNPNPNSPGCAHTSAKRCPSGEVSAERSVPWPHAARCHALKRGGSSYTKTRGDGTSESLGSVDLSTGIEQSMPVDTNPTSTSEGVQRLLLI